MQEPLFRHEQQGISSNDYYTPAWIFEKMGLQFDLDVASPPGGISWIPAKRYFTQFDDGLSQEWRGRVWMNPPFSNTIPWVEKFIKHSNGVMLAPITTSKHVSLLANSADALVILPPQFNFVRLGKEKRIGYPVALFAFGIDNVQAIAKVGRLYKASDTPPSQETR